MGRHSRRRPKPTRLGRTVNNGLAVLLVTAATAALLFAGISTFAVAMSAGSTVSTSASAAKSAATTTAKATGGKRAKKKAASTSTAASTTAKSTPAAKSSSSAKKSSTSSSPKKAAKLRTCPVSGCQATSCHGETGDPPPGR
jgi:hypothetical protein